MTLAFYMQMISLINCGTVMEVACAMQLPLAKCLPKEGLNGFITCSSSEGPDREWANGVIL